MGNNLTPYSIAIGDENICFLTPHFIIIKTEKIDDDDELLKTNKDNVDPFNYRVSICGKYFFKKLRIYKIHSNYDWFCYIQMETINVVLYFLNKLDLVGYLESSDYDKFNWIKKY